MNHRCRHVEECGGCKWQKIEYAVQLQNKQRGVEESFAPFFPEAKVNSILSCENPWHYRNKMEFSFSQNKAKDHFLGLILAGSRGKVFNVEECFLSPDWFVQALGEVRTWWIESGLTAYNFRNNTGSLRTLTLREGRHTGHKMAFLTVSGDPAYALSRPQVNQFVERLQKVAGPEVSLFLRIQQIAKGRETQFYEMHLAGQDHILEMLEVGRRGKIERLTFKISPTSFFQTNSKQAEVLFTEVLDRVNVHSESVVYDLYCGTATLGVAVAPLVKKVVGIELNPHAIFDAEVNKALNGAETVELHCGDVGAVLAKNVLPKPDLIIVDPPRAGLEKMALEQVGALGAKEIIYVSCNPKTLAENCFALAEKGYLIEEIQPLDLFPHTPHIETICRLKLRFPANFS